MMLGITDILNPNPGRKFNLNESLSNDEYLALLDNLKANTSVEFVSPYFQTKDDPKIGLSPYFYVKLKDRNDYALLDEFASENDAVVVGQNRFMPLWYTMKCTSSSTKTAIEVANLFKESGAFTYAEPDLMPDNFFQCVNDPEFPDQWGLENTGQFGGTAGIDINACDAWEITTGSRDVAVAVLDHGFEMNHPDLAGNNLGTGFDTGSGTSPSLVLGSHGTACAGIVGAVQDNNTGVSGVAPDARLISISNPLFLTSTVIQELADGINWAWANNADVISNSWGSNALSSALIDNAITNALNNGRGGLGTVVVFSAGNANGAVIYPASSNPDIVCVGAMSMCGERKNPSSCDGETWWGSCFGNELDIMAPGVQIATTDRQGANGYNTTAGTAGDYVGNFNGTSSACPAVAGVAALILSINPCLTHDEVEDILEQTAQKVGGYTYTTTTGRPNGTWDNEMGYGLVDAEAAVIAAEATLPTGSNFDLYIKDRPFDIGTEPNPDTGPMWISEDIWVRQSLDGGTTHQNPEFKMFSPNGIYVTVRNRGTQTSPCADLKVYFSKASTGLVWPTHWDDYFISGILHGDLINTVSIPEIPAGGSVVIEVPWYPPNPADFTTDIHHFCLLARVISPSDPMFNEQTWNWSKS